MIDGYHVLLHRKHGLVVARRIPIASHYFFYIWHDAEGKQHTVRDRSTQIKSVAPANITPRD